MKRDTRPRKSISRWAGSLLFMLLCAVAAGAQLTIGENLNMNLSGNLGFGYTGEFGNTLLQSSHSQGFSGDANLTGYYFNPNFLSFEVRPYYERSQLNSDSQDIITGSGIGASVNLFSGSHFPFAVSYGKEFSNSSEFRLAGVPSLFGDGSGQTFSVTWSELVPNWPQLFANFYTSSTSNSLVGINGESSGATKNFNLNSTYTLAGFDLRANFNHQNNSFTSPTFLEPIAFNTSGSSNSYGFSLQHRLPMSGGFGVGWNHSSYETDGGNDSSTSTVVGSAGFSPWRPLSINGSVTYTSNLTAALGQQLVGEGNAPVLLNDFGSNSLSINSSATLGIGHGFAATGYVNHRRQDFQGTEYVDTQFGGALNYRYNHRFFGLLYFGLGMVDTANQYGNQGMGLTANVGMNKKFGGWDTSADFSYAQNVQTLVVFATTNSYSYGASVRRRLNRDTYWSAFFRGAHSGLSYQEGTGSRSESIASSIGWRRYSFSGTYSQSYGTALLTSSGALTPTPIAGLVTDDFLYFNARSYGLTASTRLFRSLSFAATYANVRSDTLAQTLNSYNNGERYGARMEYRLRKFSIVGAYSRTGQEISSTSLPRQVINSYSLSLTRWFQVF